jgi:carbon storage regulator CsrA
MLVLSRKPNERICINGNIWITILDTHGGRTRVAIDAPKDIVISREELISTNESEEPHERDTH